MKKIFLFIFIVLSHTLIDVSGQTYFKRSYGFGSINSARDVLQTNDHGFAATGSTTPGWGGQTNFYLLKTDSLGSPEFQFSYGGNGIDQSFALIQAADSGFVMAGYSNSFTINNDYNALLVKADKNGNQLWSKSFGTFDWDFIYSMKPTTDGNFILAGNSYGSGNGTSSGYVVKTDTAGNVLWQKFIEQDKLVTLKFIATRPDGTYIVCGNVSTSPSYFEDGFVAFLDANGDTTRTVIVDNGKHESINSIDFFSNGDLAMVGTTIDSLDNDNEDEFSMRMDTSGNILWFIPQNKPDKENNNDVYVNFDTLIAFGTAGNGAGKSDFHIVKYDGSGNYINGSGHTYGGAEDDFCYRGRRTNDGNYILAGTTTSYGPGLQSVLVVKADSTFTQNPTVVIDVEEVNATDHFSVFPNPSNGNMYIHSSFVSDECWVTVFNSLGEKVYSANLKGNSRKINFSLTSGLYIVEINSGRFTERKKILIQQ